jgi:hypothetical protein
MTGIGTTSTTKAIASPAPSSKDLGQMMTMSVTTNMTWSTDRRKNMLTPLSTGPALQQNQLLRPPFHLHWNIQLYDQAEGKDQGSVSQILGFMGWLYVSSKLSVMVRVLKRKLQDNFAS